MPIFEPKKACYRQRLQTTAIRLKLRIEKKKSTAYTVLKNMTRIRRVVNIKISQVTRIRRKLKELKALVVNIFTLNLDPLAGILRRTIYSKMKILPVYSSGVIVILLGLDCCRDRVQKGTRIKDKYLAWNYRILSNNSWDNTIVGAIRAILFVENQTPQTCIHH